MDLNLTAEQEELQKDAIEFLEAECPWTQVKEVDETDDGFSPALWKKIAAKGWLGLCLPEKYGGGGKSLTHAGVLYEEMGRYLLPGPYFSSAMLCGEIIASAGSNEQKEELLPAIISGEKILSLAFTEIDYGWTADCIHLTAEPNNGNFVLNGKKAFVHDAHIADQIICVARTKESSNPEEGISLFLVDKNATGLSIRDLPGFIGEKHNELTFDSVEVSAENIIGTTNRGWAAMSKPLSRAMVVLSAYMVGGCQKVFELTIDRCRTRWAFGRNIGRFQWMQTYVTDQAFHLEGARWTMYEALSKIDNDKPDEEQEIAVSLAKSVASDAYFEVDSKAHEVYAGQGIHLDFPLYLYTKKARVYYNYLGDSSHHRRRLAGLLGM